MRKIEIERSSLANAAYDHILESLLNQELRPGARLRMDELAEQLGISRTPVRDALQRLEMERVIEPYGGRGYVIRELTDVDLDQRYAAREAIEGWAAATVAQLGGQAIATVTQEFERLCRIPPTTPFEVYEVNRAVHRITVFATENIYVLGMFDTIWSVAMSSQVWADIFESKTGIENFAADHRPLIDAIASGDADAAQQAAVQHIRIGRRLHAPHPNG